VTGGYFLYKQFGMQDASLPYETKRPERRTIKRIIDTTGRLDVAEKSKIGSLVAGTIKKLYVAENEWVKQGQQLALIETGKEDTDVRQAEGALERTQAEYHYLKNNYERQKVIYQAGQLSQDEFESIERDYLAKKGDLLQAKALFEKAERDYANINVLAPHPGMIIRVGVTEGQRITTDLDATVLFEIARDITKMEANLEVDESNIGHVQRKQKVEFTVESFPNKIFYTAVSEIAYSPKAKGGDLYYKTVVPVDNRQKLLRPGLGVEAKIFIAQAESALAISSKAFMISSKVLKEIAKSLGYSFHPVDEKAYAKQEKNIRKITPNYLGCTKN